LNRREFLQAAAALQAAKPPAQQAGLEVRLNFVFILIDDLGWRDVGFNGSKFFETPNIDKLAAQGMKFPNAYAACPVCSPSRAAILTGKYPARLGITNFLPGHHQLPYSKLLPPESKQFLPLEEVTIAEELKPLGYMTAAIGKWHLGGARYYPENQGFDMNVAGTDSGAPTSHFYPAWAGNPPIMAASGDYLADTLTDAAETFIHRNATHPFFLYLAHYGVHIPLEAKASGVVAFQPKVNLKDPQHNAVYAAMVRSIDESVGRIVKKVTDEGLSDRTVFIFTSDNGGLVSDEYRGQAATSNLPLKAGKGFLYEGGIREPLCIVWPGVTKPGSVSTMPVTGTDFYRTIAQMAGVTKLKGSPRDGVSLVPMLRRGIVPQRDALFWHYPHYSNQGGRPGGAIRMGDWKLIRWYEDDSIEFYNLRTDPGEKTNLATQEAAKARGMLAIFNDWLTAMKPEMPKPNPDYDQAVETLGLAPAIQDQLKNGDLPTPAGVKLDAPPPPPDLPKQP
jgi:arylsulfatase A-like enzyme